MKTRHRFHKKIRKPSKKDNTIFWRSDYYSTIEKIREELKTRKEHKDED
jgi:hypothetical protein